MKFKTFFIGFFLLFAALSCDKEDAIFDESTTLTSTNLKVSSRAPSISGPSCVLPNRNASFTLETNGITNIVWGVEGNASILGGQGTTNITIAFSSDWNGGFITLNGNSNGLAYFNRLEVRKCSIIVDPCEGLWLGIPNAYIDGPAGGTDEIFLLASGNFPSGTTYSWQITRENGNIDLYNASTENPRRLIASFANKVVRAEVTARFRNCTKTAIIIFNQPIPDTENPFAGAENAF